MDITAVRYCVSWKKWVSYKKNSVKPFFGLGRVFFRSKMAIFAAKCLRMLFGTLSDYAIFLVLTLGLDRPMLIKYFVDDP